jgi:transcription-repair coupling factor (superfamily II helicase)
LHKPASQGGGFLRFHGLVNILRQSEEYNIINAAFKNNKIPCQVHGLSESQKAFVSYGLFEDLKNQILVLAYNEIEARKIYDDLKVFTNACAYFPIKEMVFNVDVTSGEIKRERLEVIKKVLDGEKIIVVTSIDAIFYRMPQGRL